MLPHPWLRVCTSEPQTPQCVIASSTSSSVKFFGWNDTMSSELQAEGSDKSEVSVLPVPIHGANTLRTCQCVALEFDHSAVTWVSCCSAVVVNGNASRLPQRTIYIGTQKLALQRTCRLSSVGVAYRSAGAIDSVNTEFRRVLSCSAAHLLLPVPHRNCQLYEPTYASSRQGLSASIDHASELGPLSCSLSHWRLSRGTGVQISARIWLTLTAAAGPQSLRGNHVSTRCLRQKGR